MSGTFSKRHGYGKSARTLIHEAAPEGLRTGIWNLIEDYIYQKSLPTVLPSYESLYTKLTAHFRMKRMEGTGHDILIKDMVMQSFRWHEVFDLIEFLFTEVFYYDYDESEGAWTTFPNKVGHARYKYTKDINHLLSSENIGWELKKGRLERLGSEVLDRQIIEKARKLLINPDFAGPNYQFNKAIGFFSKRPKPDLENCVKEAVCALEGLSRVLLKDKNITLGDATNLMVGKKIIRKPLDKTFHSLYGFVSTEPGPRHGAHILPSIDIAEAEFVLYNSAVCMLFLADKFGVSLAQEVSVEPFPPSDEKVPDFPAEEEPPDFVADDEFQDSPAEEELPDLPDDDDVPF
jgi:hypothetical protein